MWSQFVGDRQLKFDCTLTKLVPENVKIVIKIFHAGENNVMRDLSIQYIFEESLANLNFISSVLKAGIILGFFTYCKPILPPYSTFKAWLTCGL